MARQDVDVQTGVGLYLTCKGRRPENSPVDGEMGESDLNASLSGKVKRGVKM